MTDKVNRKPKDRAQSPGQVLSKEEASQVATLIEKLAGPLPKDDWAVMWVLLSPLPSRSSVRAEAALPGPPVSPKAAPRKSGGTLPLVPFSSFQALAAKATFPFTWPGLVSLLG